MRRFVLVFAFLIPFAATAQRPARQAEVRVQKTSLSREQEIALGKQAAAQVEREMEVIHNPEIERWLNQIGQKLAQTPEANAYPYYFKLVNDDSINAFALPGGPMFVNTGLIKAADSEGEVAGVLAHEMSHVALRHSAAQINKQQTYGTLFGVLGAAAGVLTSDQNGQCGLLCQITQAGTNIGGSSVLMKFSRGYEHDADLNGARMMAAAGYDPMQLPRFFEKLEAQQGKANEPRGLALWLSDHPATGNRVEYVSQDIQFYPPRTYNANTGQFPRIKQLIATIPPPKMKPAKLLQAKEGASTRSNLPSGFKDYNANGFSIAYPPNWQVGQSDASGSLYLVPQGGAVKNQNNGIELIAGAMVDYYVPQAGAAATQLDASTREFIASMQKGDPNLRAGSPERATVGGKPALRTRMTTNTSYQQDPQQVVYVYTVQRDAGLWYIAQAVPASQASSFDAAFRQMIGSVQFGNQ